MDKKHYEVSSHVKGLYEHYCGEREYQIEETGRSAHKKQFYLADVRDNLAHRMSEEHEREYRRGSGSELDGKMCSLTSSSAMTFNLIGNGPVVLKQNDIGAPAGEYSVEFEHQAKVLARHGGLPANLDAWLVSKGDRSTIVACEMKMTEWLFNKPGQLKEAYFDPDNYVAYGSVFVAAAKALADAGFKRYDWAQMFKHAAAVFHELYVSKATSMDYRNAILLNVVWEPMGRSWPDDIEEWYRAAEQQEHAEFRRFKEIMLPVCALFLDEMGIDFHIKYRSAEEFICMQDIDSLKLLRKLMRYRY